MCSDLTDSTRLGALYLRDGKNAENYICIERSYYWVVAPRIFFNFQPEPWGNDPI